MLLIIPLTSCKYCPLGLTITGSRTFTVGNNLALTCTTDIYISTTTIEWIWRCSNGTETLVTTFGSGSAVLELHPVTVSMHETTLTCKATGTYGSEERSIAVSVNGKWSVVVLIRFDSLRYAQFHQIGGLPQLNPPSHPNPLKEMSTPTCVPLYSEMVLKQHQR